MNGIPPSPFRQIGQRWRSVGAMHAPARAASLEAVAAVELPLAHIFFPPLSSLDVSGKVRERSAEAVQDCVPSVMFCIPFVR